MKSIFLACALSLQPVFCGYQPSPDPWNQIVAIYRKALFDIDKLKSHDAREWKRVRDYTHRTFVAMGIYDPDADDLTQDTVIGLLKAIDHIWVAARTYLHGIIKNQVKEHIDRKVREHPRWQSIEGLNPKDYEPSIDVRMIHQSEEAKHKRLVADAMAELSLRQREVLQSRLEGLSIPQIMARLNLSKAEVKQGLGNARSQLNILIHRAKRNLLLIILLIPYHDYRHSVLESA